MEVLQKLGIALGFATLAGLNLYLTVFATSLAHPFRLDRPVAGVPEPRCPRARCRQS